MSTACAGVDGNLPEGRGDVAVLESTMQEDIAFHRQCADARDMQGTARFARRVHRRVGMTHAAAHRPPGWDASSYWRKTRISPPLWTWRVFGLTESERRPFHHGDSIANHARRRRDRCIRGTARSAISNATMPLDFSDFVAPGMIMSIGLALWANWSHAHPG